MSALTVPVTITGIESGLSETMDAVVDAGVLHSVIPADTLARLGITPDWPHSFGVGMPDGNRVELPRGSAKARIHIPVDGSELYRDDLCRTVPILFGPQKSQPVLGRTTLSFMDLAVDPDGDGLIPAEVRIPGDAMSELMIVNGWRSPAGEG